MNSQDLSREDHVQAVEDVRLCDTWSEVRNFRRAISWGIIRVQKHGTPVHVANEMVGSDVDQNGNEDGHKD